MPCNARVVVTAKVKVNDINKIPGITKTSTGYRSELNRWTTIDIDNNGNATLRCTLDNWDDGCAMIGVAIRMLQERRQVDISDVGKPETHRHQPQPQAQGVRA